MLSSKYMTQQIKKNTNQKGLWGGLRAPDNALWVSSSSMPLQQQQHTFLEMIQKDGFEGMAHLVPCDQAAQVVENHANALQHENAQRERHCAVIASWKIPQSPWSLIAMATTRYKFYDLLSLDDRQILSQRGNMTIHEDLITSISNFNDTDGRYNYFDLLGDVIQHTGMSAEAFWEKCQKTVDEPKFVFFGHWDDSPFENVEGFSQLLQQYREYKMSQKTKGQLLNEIKQLRLSKAVPNTSGASKKM